MFLLTLILLTFGTFAVNIPFGYFRSKERKFSFKWLLYIHIPIPFVFFMRTWLEYSYRAIPFLLAGALIGQLLGGYLNRTR